MFFWQYIQLIIKLKILWILEKSIIINLLYSEILYN